MKFRKILVSVLLCLTLISQVTIAFAGTEVSGNDVRLSGVLQKYNLKLYDTYYIGNVDYECYTDKSKNIRLYYNESKDILITDANTLKKLEIIYFVTNQNSGFYGFFTESNLKVHIAELRKELEEKSNKLKDKYANLDFWKGLAYATGSLGQTASDGKNVIVSHDNMYKSTAQGILLQYLQSTQDKAIRNEKLKTYASQLIQSSIFATFEDCIWNLKEAESIYSKTSIKDLKHFDKANEVFAKYQFASVIFTYAWNYAEKEMIPEITKDGDNTIGWMMNYALVGAFQLDPALLTAGANNASYPKHEALIKYIKDNDIDENDMADVFGFAVNTYNNTLSEEEKKVLKLLGDIDPYFKETYSVISDKKDTLLDEIGNVAFQSVYKTMGGFKIYKQNSWSVQSVKNMINLGIIKKYTIYPYQDEISREELYNLLFNVYSYLKSNPEVNYTDTFIDTDNINILKLYSLGIISETSTNIISPDEDITREQASEAVGKLMRLLGYSSISKTTKFKDGASISNSAKEYVQLVSGLGIIEGNDGNFYPKKSMTYEEAIVICDRIISNNNSLMEDKNIINLVDYLCYAINNSDDSFSNVSKVSGSQMHICVYEFLHDNYNKLEEYGYDGKNKSQNYGTYEWVEYKYNQDYGYYCSGIPLKAKNIEYIAKSFFGDSFNKQAFESQEDRGLEFSKGKYYFAMGDGGSSKYAKISKIAYEGNGKYSISATKYYDSEFDEEEPEKLFDFTITVISDTKSLFGYHIVSCKID